jgi:hypothetical protein
MKRNSMVAQASQQVQCKESTPMLMTILLVVLVLALLGAVPAWPHSREWGYGPSGALGAVLLIVVILVLLGRA